MASQTVLVTGATGYIGGRLVPSLLEAGHGVRVLARTPEKLAEVGWRDRVDVVGGDIADREVLAEAFAGVDCAYYLVHSMGGSADFAHRDREAAEAFREAAAEAGVGRIVYLGGLGHEDDRHLSEHLRSRHEVGEVLAAGPVDVVELRAAIIIGSGSASFEMLRNLVEVLPVMTTPRWVETLCQPIAIRNMLQHLVTALEVPARGHRIIEVGGPDVLTYREMMQQYAEEAGLGRRLILPVPVLTPGLSSHWIGLVTPLPSGLARPLVESLINEVIVTDPSPEMPPEDNIAFRRSVQLALRRVENLDVATSWSDAGLPGRTPADPLPTDPDWSGGTMFADQQEVASAAAPEALYDTVQGIGGDRGWYVADPLWLLRGLADRAVGGIGLRRGRRHPDEVRVGDALDFWRVEAHDRPNLLRLRAEMRLPGEAWLEWRVTPAGDGAVLSQRALFHPRGLWGRLYWYALVPFHAMIFHRMATRLAAAAEQRPSTVEQGGPSGAADQLSS
jgi:uncharacterized protein YbjT (DUF2867 family)